MKKAFGRKELLLVVPLSWSTICRLEAEGEFPKRWYITDRRCAWDGDEVEQWLDERKAASPKEFVGKKPPVDKRVSRPVSKAT
ncbi:AlpA family phage regulatory protein [Raoultella ornithinolytica]|uniref:helix-turn-helix transcriptional regulator n=1 Tax=Raoultella ornithinolytica TaxID=54291 RepID=UPI000C2843F0|nr:AlpA family phage regulatory protein [Raoultella ornithinolytica]HBT0447831.1 AlpA family phage regulatory protein [Klebsiella pneumoniae]ELT0846810.1 AlpA family phage regulatory protein [Raoultella ornithinolytica]MEB7898747.1 AlpA family phage regulatory protein [Raoultella ornithinolytica]PJR11603.1 transcriptional regulator [Raoultella ornithinolytica]PQH34118.1 AlpA family phage regulatory protein [Raoultella ornithinolytica]